jgi:hypothetical protein
VSGNSSPRLGRQRLALERQSSSLLGGERDPGLAGRRRECLLEDADLLVQVLDPARHPLVDRVCEHRDDELDGHREHRSAARMPAERGKLQSVPAPRIMEQSWRDAILDTTGVAAEHDGPIEKCTTRD